MENAKQKFIMISSSRENRNVESEREYCYICFPWVWHSSVLPEYCSIVFVLVDMQPWKYPLTHPWAEDELPSYYDMKDAKNLPERRKKRTENKTKSKGADGQIKEWCGAAS